MADCISRESEIADFDKCNSDNPAWTPQRVKTLLMRVPAIDVEPVRRGRWKPVYESEMTGWNPEFSECDQIGGYFCSNCNYKAIYSCNDEYVLSNYCPNCGFKMGADDDNNEFAPLDEDEDGEDYWDV